jgi:O-antigen/teichoic acid export membrane protein
VLVTALSIPLVVAGPGILTLVYGPDFAAAGLAVRLLVFEAALSTVTQVLSQAFMALNRPGLSSVQYGAGVAVAIALLLVLPSRLGLTGAAIALLTAAVVRLAATYWSLAIVLKSGAPPIRRELGYSLATLRAALRGGP